MKQHQRLLTLALTGAVAVGSSLGLATPARADTASTAAIALGAAAIVGSLLYDANNQPYYVRGGRHVYVSHQVANYWQQRHHNERNDRGRDDRHSDHRDYDHH